MNDVITFSNESTINNKACLLHDLLADTDFAYVTLVSGDNQHEAAHRAVLGASSPFLRRILYESLQQRAFLYLGQVDRQVVEALVQWLYLGQCEVARVWTDQLHSLAGQLGVQELQEAKNGVIGRDRKNLQDVTAAVIGQDRKDLPGATTVLIGEDRKDLKEASAVVIGQERKEHQEATVDFISPDL